MPRPDNAVRADEFMKQLEADPEYQRREAERRRREAEREREVAAASDRVLAELSAAGFQVAAIEDLVARYAPLPAGAVDALIRSIPRVPNSAVLEAMVRALAAAGGVFDGRPLTALFSRSPDALRWAIANTIAAGKAKHVKDWVLTHLRDPATGIAREMLAVAAAEVAPADEALPVLLEVLPDLPGYAAMALARLGDARAVAPLREVQKRAKKWEKKEIAKAIRACAAGR